MHADDAFDHVATAVVEGRSHASHSLIRDAFKAAENHNLSPDVAADLVCRATESRQRGEYTTRYIIASRMQGIAWVRSVHATPIRLDGNH